MGKKINKKQIENVLKVNSCLKPEHWDKPMFDSFMLGYKLGIDKKKRNSPKGEETNKNGNTKRHKGSFE